MPDSIQSSTTSEHLSNPPEWRTEFENNLRLELQALGLSDAAIENIVRKSKTVVTSENVHQLD